MQVKNNTPASPQVLQAKQRFGIIGNAPALSAAVERAIRVAPIDLSVLVTGESGAGKEFFPQIIHAYSARKHAKYIAVNCGAIPEGTIDSELFGHEKGAFTGAVDSRKGYFEEADGGTIFLDEVAELPLTTQARLLRVLESGEYLKVGSSTVQRTSVRIVAATNVDLQAAVAQGKFREDLYYRLSTVQIHIPPLRDRGVDIGLLSRKFASDFAERYRMPPITMSTEAEDVMRHYRWPGNVRQLKNVVEQLALFEAGKEVTPHTLEQYLPSISTSYMPAVGVESHSYQREREMLFGMIFNLQSRIDELQSRLDNTGVHISKGALIEPERDKKTTPSPLRSWFTAPMPAARYHRAPKCLMPRLSTPRKPSKTTNAKQYAVHCCATTVAERPLPTNCRFLSVLYIEKLRNMALNKFHACLAPILFVIFAPIPFGCKISVSMNGSALDYNVYHTIHVSEFPIRAALVYRRCSRCSKTLYSTTSAKTPDCRPPTVHPTYSSKAKSQATHSAPRAVTENAYASMTRLTITVRVKYIDNKEEGKDIDRTFSAYRDFPSTEMLTDVQDQLCEEICKELVELIFNATLGNW